ncbi:tetratricopeptide repeat protein [Parahaliea aestuarii]|uniref:Tetratricopeptide repeat protein n=1 Tax=Parahaliea aestuarii TaxID=1852021 RepID=A0A5C8ZY12_9GAMM|nr:tetratricopeptide repeat protein [Parahaliea aestuarii]TXS93445.1 tetratricopeptide repeat protein [Parahaliea aestuarii]
MTRLRACNPRRPLGPCAFLVVLIALAAGASRADDTAAPYGERVVRNGQQWSDGASAAPGLVPEAPLPEDAAASLAAYTRAVEDLQRQGGPYAAGLAENLEAMADLQARRGDLAGAESLYTRALHIMRINEGLRSERQLSLLQSMIGLARQTGDLEQLDDRYDYLYFLQGAGQLPRDEAAVTVQLAYLRWQREALRLGVRSAQGRSRLLGLLDINDRLLEGSAADGGHPLPPDLRWPLVQSQLRNLYLLQDSLPAALDEPGFRVQSQYRSLGSAELDRERERLEQQRRSGMVRGRKLLQDYIEASPPNAADTRAAQLALADWYQWHGSSRRAAAFYSALGQDLLDAGAEEQWQAWFGEPVELPDNGAFWQIPSPGDGVAGPVGFRFEVTAEGRVRGAEVVSVPESAENAQYVMLRELRDVRFRPRLDRQGQAQATTVQRDYLWLPLRRSQWP